jgi:hypothetical protein
MKSLSEYSRQDWKRLRPLTHALKTMWYGAQREIHVRRPRQGGGVEARGLRGRRVLVTIAYDDPEVIEIQAKALARFVPHALSVIADNSSDAEAARAIAAIAERYGVPYVRLPHPWGVKDSRSHGLALNWAWRNLIRPGEPEAFGFLDDDLFPTTPDDPFATLGRQPVYGMLRPAGERWFLWAGFCMFRFDAVRDLRLDFGQDWFKGLDTGGGLWRTLYCRLDRARLAFASFRTEPYRPGADPVHDSIQWCDAWLHEGGQTRRAGRLAQADAKRQSVKDLLAARQAVAAGGMHA